MADYLEKTIDYSAMSSKRIPSAAAEINVLKNLSTLAATLGRLPAEYLSNED